MLEGSFWEFALIFVLALVVFGPERLPGFARSVGLWVGRARAMVKNLTEQIERELAVEEMRQTVDVLHQAVHEPLGTGAAKTAAQASAEPVQESVKRAPPAG